MSKKRITFATGGWMNTQSSGDMPFSGEMVVTKEEQERLAELIKNPPKPNAETVVISGEDLMYAPDGDAYSFTSSRADFS